MNAVSKPAHRLATDTENGLLVVISGPSGVGKTTITRAVERTIPGSVFSISATTRPTNDVDKEGVDYHFMDDERFDRHIAAGDFIEYATYAGNRYGTLRAPVETQLARGRLVILEIDIQGAKQVKQDLPDAFAMFILPPNEQTLLDRLRARKREDEQHIQQRFKIAKREIAEAKCCGAYDVFIVNDNLDRAIAEAVSTVTERRDVRTDR